MLKISVVVGNPKRESRTLRVARTLVDEVFAPGMAEVEVHDLADHAEELFKWPSEALTQISTAVAASDMIFFASPTYKASYTGMLKSFLDRYPAGSLEGVPVISVMTGASQAHSMAPNVTMQPLLTELGAIPLSSVYFSTTDMGTMPAIMAVHATRIRQVIARLGRLTELART